MEFPDKGLFLLHGANGSGKTTLCRCMAGMNDSYKGEILVNARPPSIKLASYLPQISTDLPNITGRAYVEQGLYMGGDEHISFLEKELHAEKLMHKSCAELSGGQKQILSIVRNLAVIKPVIIMDEPESFLSRSNRALLRTLVYRLSADYLVIISSHLHEEYENCTVLDFEEESDYKFIIT